MVDEWIGGWLDKVDDWADGWMESSTERLTNRWMTEWVSKRVGHKWVDGGCVERMKQHLKEESCVNSQSEGASRLWLTKPQSP